MVLAVAVQMQYPYEVIVTLIDVPAVVASMVAAMIAAAVHVAIFLMMVVVAAPSVSALWVSVETIGVLHVTAQREWPLLLVVVGGLLDRHLK